MKYLLLGNSGLKVSELCLGTMTFGENWGPMGASKEESQKIFNTYVEKGGNFIDTANKYTDGTSERYVGEFTQSQRERFVISTKYTLAINPDDPNSSGNHRKNLFQSVHASLKRLDTDYIDLLWVHAWDFLTPVYEVMRALDDLVRMGKIHYLGISDAPAWIIAQANTLASEKGWIPFVAMQMQYSLIQRGVERELLPMSRVFDIATTAWSPLGGGVLTGKYHKKETEQKRLNPDDPWGKEYLTEKNYRIADSVIKIAQKTERSPAQIALNWLLQKNAIPILGARTEKQVLDNLECTNFQLSDQHLNELDSVSAISLGFPYDFFTNPMAQSLVYGNVPVVNHRRKFG